MTRDQIDAVVNHELGYLDHKHNMGFSGANRPGFDAHYRAGWEEWIPPAGSIPDGTYPDDPETTERNSYARLALTEQEARQRVEWVFDDAGAIMEEGESHHAVVREVGDQFKVRSHVLMFDTITRREPIIVAVHSYMDVELRNDEAERIARDGIAELGHAHLIRKQFDDT